MSYVTERMKLKNCDVLHTNQQPSLSLTQYSKPTEWCSKILPVLKEAMYHERSKLMHLTMSFPLPYRTAEVYLEAFWHAVTPSECLPETQHRLYLTGCPWTTRQCLQWRRQRTYPSPPLPILIHKFCLGNIYFRSSNCFLPWTWVIFPL